jgi:hypothetical protein
LEYKEKEVPTKEQLKQIRDELLGESKLCFSKFLKNRIDEMDLQQKHIAEFCNVSEKTVSKWISGRGLPDIFTIPILAEVIDVSIYTIFNIIYNIKDYYDINDRIARSMFKEYFNEEGDGFNEDDRMFGAFFGKTEYNLYLVLKHIYQVNGKKYEINDFIRSDMYKDIVKTKMNMLNIKQMIFLQNLKKHNWSEEIEWEKTHPKKKPMIYVDLEQFYKKEGIQK